MHLVDYELVFVVAVIVVTKSNGVERESGEHILMEYLFQNYDARVRPSPAISKPVNMTFGLAYVQLVALDDREQTLISNVWIRQKWYNHYLRWDPKKFRNVSVLNVSPHLVWLPDIILYNNAKNSRGAGTMFKFKTKVSIGYDGMNTWYSPAIIRSACTIDISFFPFDHQYCHLHFGSWTMNVKQLDVNHDQINADTSFYLQSTEFELLSAKATRKVIKYKQSNLYANVIFVLHIRRRPGFYLYNVIIPATVITLFSVLTFSSSLRFGERLALIIESFLSLTFLCMMVADKIPINADNTPLITQFLITCMILISAVLAFNLLFMNLSGVEPVPEWLRKLMVKYIGPLVGYYNGFRNGEVRTERQSLINRMIDDKNEERRHQCIISRRFQISAGSACRRIDKAERKPVNGNERKYEIMTKNMNDIIRRSTQEYNSSINRDYLRCFAQTLDRIASLVLAVTFVFATVIMFTKGNGNQQSAKR